MKDIFTLSQMRCRVATELSRTNQDRELSALCDKLGYRTDNSRVHFTEKELRSLSNYLSVLDMLLDQYEYIRDATRP